MAKHIRCGRLFTGLEDEVRGDQTVVIEHGRLTYVGPSATAPAAAPGEEVVDHSSHFVLPGLIDVHVHLSYGNAACQEDIDLYAPREFRALRALVAAQTVLAAGYTSVADPTASGLCSFAVRDAIDAGLFPGPRITSSGQQLSSRQGLADYYPTWFGVPATAVGARARNSGEGIEKIRRQVKDGADFIKIAMDGVLTNQRTGELVACYDQQETQTMVTEAHRLGRKVVVHARSREGVLYAARAGVDVILHAYDMDEEGLEAVLENECMLCPTLCLMVNAIEFSQPSDGSYSASLDDRRAAFETACGALERAREAGVPFMSGTDSGFAVTPYGEWHARELELYVRYLGFTPADALRTATSINATLLREPNVGALEAGRRADLLVFDGDPLADITQLQNRALIRAILLDGEEVDVAIPEVDRRKVSQFSYSMWRQIYTQDRVAELRAAGAAQAAE